MTASYGESNDDFGISVAISGYTHVVETWGKGDHRGCLCGRGAYVFVLEGDILWYEGAKIIPRNGISSGDYFGWSVDLSGDRSLIWYYRSYENTSINLSSGAAYIFHRVNGVWQEEAKLVPADGSSND